MRKITATTISLLTLAAATTALAAGLCAHNAPVKANASDDVGKRLVCPLSYEEYLTLDQPSDTAVTDDYVAVADGKEIYLFVKSSGVWTKYDHSSPVTKLAFGGRDALYFLDGQTNALFLLNASAASYAATETGIICSTFSIRGDTLYYANTSAGQTWIRHAPLSDLTAASAAHKSVYSPALSFWNGEIYFLYGNDYLHRLSLDTNQSTDVAKLPQGVISMTISEGIVLCVTEGGSFYAYSLADLTEKKDAALCAPVAEIGGGYSSVSAKGKEVYLVEGSSILEYSLVAGGFTGYEIGGASSSENRLNGADALHLSGDKLFIADDGNDRISVYDRSTGRFESSIPSTLDATHLASYGDTLLVANTSQAILYSLDEESYGATLASLDSASLSGGITGLASVYGNYYIVTDTNYCYVPTRGETGYAWTETLRKAHHVDGLTSDANGFLYVLYDGSVYRYTEESFFAPDEQGEKLLSGVPSDNLSVDYDGNLYSLSAGVLYRYSKTESGYAESGRTELNLPLVYGVEPNLLSYAFGVEENECYLLYEGSYLAVTDELALPTVKNIPTGNAESQIFGETKREFSVVTVKPNALVIEYDIHALQGATVFPYQAHARSQKITALAVGYVGEYTLLSYREDLSSPYKAMLVRSDCVTLEEGRILSYEEGKTGYVTNQVGGYAFPSMGLPALFSLPRGERVTLLGEVSGQDCVYYEVEYDGKTGYLPASHISPFNGAPPTAETVVVGNGEKSPDSIWRLAYLILGTGAICILTDFLFLRKKDKE